MTGAAGHLVVAFGLALGLASVLVVPMQWLARRTGLVAAPRPDRWNPVPVPLLGGPAMMVAVLGTFAALGTLPRMFWLLLLTALAMGAVGLVDDIRALRPQTKFLAQLALASVLLGLGFQLRLTGLALVDILLTLLWVVGVTNAFNLLDNMDGLAAGVGFIAAAFRLLFFIVEGEWDGAIVSAAFMGALFGFLLRNLPPASIFMGDAGSLFLGFFLSGLCLTTVSPYSRSIGAVLLFPALFVLIPLFDTTFVTVTRIVRGRPISVGGRDHLSHRLVALGMSERRALCWLYGLSILSGTLAYLSYRAGLRYTLVPLAFLGLGLLALGVYLGRVQIVTEGGDPQERTLLRLLADFPYKRQVATMAIDLLLIILAYYSAYLLRFESEVPQYLPWFVQSLPAVIPIQLGAFAAFGVYRGMWRYVSFDDMLRLAQAVTVGSAGVVLYVVFVYRFEGYSRAVFVLDWLLLLVFVAATRSLLRLLATVLRPGPRGSRPVLIYGAGDGGEIVVRELFSNSALGRVPVGFLDDDPGKIRAAIHGVPVLGGVEGAADLIRKHGVTEVIVSTGKVSEERIRRLSETCASLGVPVVRAAVRFE